MEQTPLRPLGEVMAMIEALGHEVTYAYDDLVFINHNDFLLQFDAAEPNALALFFNTECNAAEADHVAARMIPEGIEKGLIIRRKGTYTMTEAESDNLQITFNP
ncbi:MAG TPA: hypothetical protein DEB17_02490 [Chlorobaculum sp.]|uniref:Uncharacterized protein n=1 Tax=Chlorobaculum tepidum (strain ATCC 49652 / DSM 12025 / NBRC 103806 / TLS) TaxID=194439 RepID=Q8KEI0_CHLTE|nr:hypothetical protein [Chlorobaculum tepidum]AAM71946.1 hypothetical protein CT0709 [Chlorobaculum tepidum TLS]HBU22865.1 hypothetical protein [Chlorobaculum sp.]